MYMGRIYTSVEGDLLRDLGGARVLITGLTASTGVDLARAFAGLKARLIIQTNEVTPEMTEIVAILSQTAAEIKLYTDPISNSAAAVRFAQTAAQAFGGLDAVINFSGIDPAETDGLNSKDSVEDYVAAKLSALVHFTRVTANRMRVVLNQGMILNVLTAPRCTTARSAAVTGLIRTALAAVTKDEAAAWASEGIRINAVAPGAAAVLPGLLAGEPDPGTANGADLAALAVYLASKRGRELSGHIFSADWLKPVSKAE